MKYLNDKLTDIPRRIREDFLDDEKKEQLKKLEESYPLDNDYKVESETELITLADKFRKHVLSPKLLKYCQLISGEGDTGSDFRFDHIRYAEARKIKSISKGLTMFENRIYEKFNDYLNTYFEKKRKEDEEERKEKIEKERKEKERFQERYRNQEIREPPIGKWVYLNQPDHDMIKFLDDLPFYKLPQDRMEKIKERCYGNYIQGLRLDEETIIIQYGTLIYDYPHEDNMMLVTNFNDEPIVVARAGTSIEDFVKAVTDTGYFTEEKIINLIRCLPESKFRNYKKEESKKS